MERAWNHDELFAPLHKNHTDRSQAAATTSKHGALNLQNGLCLPGCMLYKLGFAGIQSGPRSHGTPWSHSCTTTPLERGQCGIAIPRSCASAATVQYYFRTYATYQAMADINLRKTVCSAQHGSAALSNAPPCGSMVSNLFAGASLVA